MKMNMIFNLLLALTISTQVMAQEQVGTPPFDSIACTAREANVEVQVQHYRQTYGAGSAVIKANGAVWTGGWQWQAAEQGTRLSGHHHLTIAANGETGLGSFFLHALYSPYGKLTSGWVEMPGHSGAVKCKVAEAPKTAPQCKVPPQADCSVSPKRLCCDCQDGQLSCF